MVKIEEAILKRKAPPSQLVKSIIPLARQENNEVEASKHIDHMCHNNAGDTTSGKYVIKIPT